MVGLNLPEDLVSTGSEGLVPAQVTSCLLECRLGCSWNGVPEQLVFSGISSSTEQEGKGPCWGPVC